VGVDLRRRDTELTELMDSPDCDARMLDRTYAQFAAVNALYSGWRGIYRRSIRPRLSTTLVSHVLDVGSGGGDLTRALARWAARDGLRLRVTGIDPDPRAHAFAEALPAMRGVEFRRAFSRELVLAGERYDMVVSNHVLHHLSGAELGGLLFDSEQLAPRSLHADISRSWFAYAGFGISTLPFFHDSYIRADGLRSIRRSFTPGELAAVVPADWRVVPQSPVSYVLEADADA
jgi:2-polyprenyl-3-methyl-5-hydroxy-6-metoxy-1,4-benzoquinol methylase